MNGFVKMFNNNKGYGFIYSKTDNRDYFFHISDLINSPFISKGDSVEFTPHKNNKGLIAKNINILFDFDDFDDFNEFDGFDDFDLSNKPEFIILGNTRIKYSDIKNYGISTTNVKEENENYIDPGLDESIYETDNPIMNILDSFQLIIGGAAQVRNKIKGEKKYNIRNVKYLYITTYLGDNFIFKENKCNFNIYDKLNEIDRFFNRN